MKAAYVLVLSVLITVAASGIAYYFYSRYQHTQLLLKNPQEAAKQETKTIVAEVGKYMDLPAGEQPTLATVTDAQKLADQPFFKRAQNGDKVLIYIQTREAILFRPSTGKIVAVSPISITNPSPAPQVAGASIAPTQPVVLPTKAAPTAPPRPTFTPAPSPTIAR